MTKQTSQKNKPPEPDQTIGAPFEDAVRRLLQTPPIKKSKLSKPQEKKGIEST